MIKTLCFGGSFNPIHHGHLICARAAMEAGGYSRVLLIPSARPPHKPGDTTLATAPQRLEMARLAAAATTAFDVSDIELRRGGPSFTFDTAAALLQTAEVHGQVAWLIGADMLQQLPTWHRAQQLVQRVHFVVMGRPDHVIDFPSLPPPFAALQANFVQTPLVQISATDIRRRVAARLSIDHLTAPVVVDYIRRHGLYGGVEQPSGAGE